jgi:hypothetical protein
MIVSFYVGPKKHVTYFDNTDFNILAAAFLRMQNDETSGLLSGVQKKYWRHAIMNAPLTEVWIMIHYAVEFFASLPWHTWPLFTKWERVERGGKTLFPSEVGGGGAMTFLYEPPAAWMRGRERKLVGCKKSGFCLLERERNTNYIQAGKKGFW